MCWCSFGAYWTSSSPLLPMPKINCRRAIACLPKSNTIHASGEHNHNTQTVAVAGKHIWMCDMYFCQPLMRLAILTLYLSCIFGCLNCWQMVKWKFQGEIFPSEIYIYFGGKGKFKHYCTLIHKTRVFWISTAFCGKFFHFVRQAKSKSKINIFCLS